MKRTIMDFMNEFKHGESMVNYLTEHLKENERKELKENGYIELHRTGDTVEYTLGYENHHNHYKNLANQSIWGVDTLKDFLEILL